MKQKSIILIAGLICFIGIINTHVYNWFSINNQLKSIHSIEQEGGLGELVCNGPFYEISYLPNWFIAFVMLFSISFGLIIKDRFKTHNLYGLFLCLIVLTLCLIPVSELIIAYQPLPTPTSN